MLAGKTGSKLQWLGNTESGRRVDSVRFEKGNGHTIPPCEGCNDSLQDSELAREDDYNSFPEVAVNRRRTAGFRMSAYLGRMYVDLVVTSRVNRRCPFMQDRSQLAIRGKQPKP